MHITTLLRRYYKYNSKSDYLGKEFIVTNIRQLVEKS
jgi:hypothetical protein